METKVLDSGFVRLDGALADDWSVVDAARVSFLTLRYNGFRGSEDPMETGQVFTDKETGLINFLMKNHHGTPFEHNAFRFHVKAPIFVAREWMRHRIGSYNEWSGRYSKLKADFYVPDYVRSQVGKPGAYKFEAVDDKLKLTVQRVMDEHSNDSFELYEELLSAGIAKEVARMVLPLNLYTQFYWTVNARSLMNFVALRNSEHAMYEIRQYATVIEQIFTEWMPVTAEAFVNNGRVAP